MKSVKQLYPYIKLLAPYTLHAIIGIVILMSLFQSVFAEQVYLVK